MPDCSIWNRPVRFIVSFGEFELIPNDVVLLTGRFALNLAQAERLLFGIPLFDPGVV